MLETTLIVAIALIGLTTAIVKLATVIVEFKKEQKK